MQLGESGHGVAEFDLAKVRVIEYLHEELGYDVIAFESSVFECDHAQRAVATLSAEQMMGACIFGVWHAAETRSLFEYIKQTQSTARPLVLAGFDSQTSSYTANARPAFFRQLIARIDTAYARDVFERDSKYLVSFRVVDTTTAQRDRAAKMAFYDSLATWFRTNEQPTTSLLPDDRFAPMIARQTAISMKAFTDQMSHGPATGTPVRDLAMADNLDFLLAERHSGKEDDGVGAQLSRPASRASGPSRRRRHRVDADHHGCVDRAPASPGTLHHRPVHVCRSAATNSTQV